MEKSQKLKVSIFSHYAVTTLISTPARLIPYIRCQQKHTILLDPKDEKDTDEVVYFYYNRDTSHSSLILAEH